MVILSMVTVGSDKFLGAITFRKIEKPSTSPVTVASISSVLADRWA
jgi:hypothetical protein